MQFCLTSLMVSIFLILLANMVKDRYGGPNIAIMVFGILGLVISAACTFIIVVDKSAVRGEIAALEQLRKDSAAIDPKAGAYVYARVVDWNQKIVEHQELRKGWFGKQFIPVEWESVQTIAVPNGSEK